MTDQPPTSDLTGSGVNLLGYERLDPSADMIWVLRWVGVWVMANGVAGLAQYAVYMIQMSMSQVIVMRGFTPLRILSFLWENIWGLGGLMSVLVGLGIMGRRRVAFYAAFILLPLSVLRFPNIDSWLGILFTLLQTVPVDIVLFAILWKLWCRAESRGVLIPTRHKMLGDVPQGNDRLFLLQCVGWNFTSFLFVIVLNLAAYPLLVRYATQRGPWNWYSAVITGSFLLRGLFGLALVYRKRLALLAIVILLPAEIAGQQIAMRASYNSPFQLISLLMPCLQITMISAMLIWLYRRLPRELVSS